MNKARDALRWSNLVNMLVFLKVFAPLAFS